MLLEILEGWGYFSLKNGNSGGGRVLTEIPSVVGVWIFSGTGTQYSDTNNC